MKRKKRFPSYRNKNKKAQIWVETVLYTLIAFTLIALVLAFVKPKIEEIQDRGVIEQSLSVLEEIDLIIETIGVPGNQRVIELGINKGNLNIDGENDKIFFELESRSEYSQPGEDVNVGSIIVRTEEKENINEVTLTREYTEYNITVDNLNILEVISSASTPYRIIISNEGEDSSKKTIINFEVIN